MRALPRTLGSIIRYFSEHVASASPRTRLEKLRSVQPGDDVARFLRKPVPAAAVPDEYTLEEREAALKRPTLSDNFGRVHTYLRISLTERCNLRCQYCMPADGVQLQPADHMLTSDEIVKLASLFVAQGVDKIRLTGGEPTIRRDIIDLCRRIGEIPGLKTLAMTTNGLTLKRLLPSLSAARVTHLNISLDTLQADKFERITRRTGFQRVLDSIYAALDAGFNPVKVNCVVMRGVNDDEIASFVELTRALPLDVRFIEYMPFDANAWNDEKFIPYTSMISVIRERFPSFAKQQDSSHDTSKAYRVPGFAGQVGFITSMSEHFCGSCNRLRITADGNIKVCLFDNREVSLRDALRRGDSQQQLNEVVALALGRKQAVLGGNADMYGIASSKNRPMILIGG